MLTAIQLDGQSERRTVEIQDISSNAELTDESQPLESPRPQSIPKLRFGVGLTFPQISPAVFYFNDIEYFGHTELKN